MTVGIYKQTAKDIMTSHVATIHHRDTVHEALHLMADNRLSTLPVVDQYDRCIGMVSQSDLIAITGQADAHEQAMQSMGDTAAALFGRGQLNDITDERIEDVMSDDPIIASEDELVTSVADKMLEKEVHHVPVCNGDGVLQGLISTMDILRAIRTSPVAGVR